LFFYVSPAFYFLFWIFPVDATTVGLSDRVIGEFVGRSWGLTIACSGVVFYLLARYGIRQLLERRIGLFAVLVAVAAIGAFGGFRSYLILVGIAFVSVFFLEGLHRSKYLGLFVLAGALLTAFTVAQPDKLPLSVQRSISFLPLNVSPAARMSADASSDWRIQLWKTLLPDVSKYFWLGKGLALHGQQFAATVDASQRTGNSAEVATLAGDYHNGPLSVIIPFGIWGVIGFVWFLAASIRVLYTNYLYGAPELKIMNRFLFAYFLTRAVIFVTVFGGFYSDLAIFAGIVALSISLNHGVARKLSPAPEVSSAPVLANPTFRPRSLARLAR
jgi:hypothetical protein